MEWDKGAAVAAAVIATLWLILLPRDARGKAWHYLLAPVPLLVTLAIWILPPGVLRTVGVAWIGGGAGALSLLLLTWGAGTLTRNHGLMDVVYPIAPGVIAWSAWLLAGGTSTAAILALSAVTLWGARLSWQTLGQNHAQEREPYASWRARGGARWLFWSLFQVYLLQGVMIWLWSAPLVFAVMAADDGAVLPWLGFAVWICGFALQAAADRQLARFRAAGGGRGRILDTGVWALVRQPNYLGEAIMWWGYFLCGLAHPLGWVAVGAPIFATWFMGFGSAGPFKERHMARTRGEAWQAYCRRTPRFFPWPRPGAIGKIGS